MSTEVLDRIRFEAIPAPAVTRKTATSRPRSWLRLPAYALVALAVTAVGGGGLWWAHFRYGHIVSRNASVKGRIAQVGARFDGVVQRFAVEAGERVYAGDVLARLDDRHLQAAHRGAQAEFERATQRLEVERLAIEHERRRLDTRLVEAHAVSNAEVARLGAAESKAAKARRDYDRIVDLRSRGASADEELADAETTLRTALAEVDAARADCEAAKAAQTAAAVELEGLVVRQVELSVYESRLEVARAAVAEAEADLEAAVIRAPEDGRVIRRVVESGGSARRSGHRGVVDRRRGLGRGVDRRDRAFSGRDRRPGERNG